MSGRGDRAHMGTRSRERRTRTVEEAAGNGGFYQSLTDIGRPSIPKQSGGASIDFMNE